MIEIPELTNEEIAFGAPNKIFNILPKWEDIPEEFKGYDADTKWNELFTDMFFVGLEDIQLIPKEGVDSKKAWMVIRAISGSFAPKHEHKTAGVAYLMSEWFKDVTWKAAKRS